MIPRGQSLHVLQGVTSLDFSSRNPNILAVGLYDGTIAMYDIQSKSSTPMMESQENAGKHPDPVWQVTCVVLIVGECGHAKVTGAERETY